MSDVDLIGALITYLIGQADVSELISTRVYGQELPAAQAASMPRKALVLRYAGQGSWSGGANSWVRHGSIRIDAWHYGETFYQADRLRRTVHPVLKSIGRKLQGNCLIHSLSDLAGPIPVLDPETGWPFIVDTYSVLYGEAPVT